MENNSNERAEVLKQLEANFGAGNAEYVGNGRYTVRQRYEVEVPGGLTTWLYKYKLFGEDGSIIPLTNDYDGIFKFTRGIAVVCLRNNISIKNDRFTQERRDGLLDVNGKEILPCIYDSIKVKMDGYVEISKGGVTKASNVSEILVGKFSWENAIEKTF